MKSSSYTLWGIQFSLKPAFHLISEFQTFHYSYSIYLLSCFWQERESLTKIEEDEKILKNKLLKAAASYTYCPKKKAKIWVYQANTTDISMGHRFCREAKELQLSHWWGSIFHVSWWAAEGKDKGRHKPWTTPVFPIHCHSRSYFLLLGKDLIFLHILMLSIE